MADDTLHGLDGLDQVRTAIADLFALAETDDREEP